MGVGVAASSHNFHSFGLVRFQFQYRPHETRSLRKVFPGDRFPPRYPNEKISCNNIRGNSIANCTKSATPITAISTASDGGGNLLELAEIKESYRKWLWKGQYSINYFVSPFLPSSSSNSNPPLLLVHGFGASILHWRRLVAFSMHRFSGPFTLACILSCYFVAYLFLVSVRYKL